MNIDEKIKELEEKQAEISKEIDKLKIEKKTTRPRLKSGETYKFLADDGGIKSCMENYTAIDDYRYNTGNYYDIDVSASLLIRQRENNITHQQLKDIALRLNKGQPMDWEDIEQKKYCIHYDWDTYTFRKNINSIVKNLNTVYCLDENFLNVALSEIGKEKLKQLLEWGI